MQKPIVWRRWLDIIQYQPTDRSKTSEKGKTKHRVPFFIREVVLFKISVRRHVSIITIMNDGLKSLRVMNSKIERNAYHPTNLHSMLLNDMVIWRAS